MSGTRGRIDSLLRWYPPAWRERYGDEMTALLEDTLGDQSASLALRWSLALAGLRERGHESGLVGDASSTKEQSLAGSLLVLCAWSVATLGGVSFVKLSEHFARSMPAASRASAQDAYNAVTLAGAIGALFVVTGSLVVLPSLARFLRHGGWTFVRRHVVRAMILSVIAAAGLLAIKSWATGLTTVQRNGADDWYSLAVMVWAGVVAMVVALWTVVGVVTVKRMTLSPWAIRVEGTLALGVSTAMLAVTTGTALWWSEVGTHAPWFLSGLAVGQSASPLSSNLIVTMAVLSSALAMSFYGSVRIVRSWKGPIAR